MSEFDKSFRALQICKSQIYLLAIATVSTTARVPTDTVLGAYLLCEAGSILEHYNCIFFLTFDVYIFKISNVESQSFKCLAFFLE